MKNTATEKAKVLSGLRELRERLSGEVVEAYEGRGATFGGERFAAWRKRASRFLDKHLPGESSLLNAKLTHFGFAIVRGEADVDTFWREDGEVALSFLDSLIVDIEKDEYEEPPVRSAQEDSRSHSEKQKPRSSDKVFIVHGHDESTKMQVARFIERAGLEAVILHEQPSGGRTIIEKIEMYTDGGLRSRCLVQTTWETLDQRQKSETLTLAPVKMSSLNTVI